MIMSKTKKELIEEINSNSLQIEQLSEDVRGLTYAIRDLMEIVQSVGLEVVDDDDRVMN
tara:strand:- start:451 stop:627 length:177 start_codon:yes stop_codon:yes gene_type:complete